MSEQVLWQARDVILSRDGQVEPFEGQTNQRVESVATGPGYSLLTNHGWTMRLAYLHWENGEREMRALDCNSTEHRMHGICNRIRISVYEVEGNPRLSWMELIQAYVEEGSDRPKKRKASAVQVLEGAGGLHPAQVFRNLDASFGTRSEILSDTGSHRDFLCVAFRRDDLVVPPVAFVLTRVLPVWNRYRGPR